MSTDLYDRLVTLRPNPTLDAGARSAILAAIVGSEPGMALCATRFLRPARRRRLVLAVAAVGIAATAVVVVPVLAPAWSPGGATPAAAAELDRLAVAAGRGSVITPGTFRSVVSTQTQTGVRPAPGAPGVTIHEQTQSWTGADGRVWTQDRGIDSAGQAFLDTASYSADDLGSLPTDPPSLAAYLRGHAVGGESVDEVVFSALTDVLSSGRTPPGLQSAALAVLGRSGHVTLTRDARDDSGRSAERFDFVDRTTRPGEVQSLFIDAGSAELLEMRDTQPGSRTVYLVRSAVIVDAVPAAVRAAAAAQRPGPGGAGG